MTDARLVATNPETSELVPVAVNAQGQLKTEIGVIEEIPNDLLISGNLDVTGNLTVNGETPGGGDVVGLPTPFGPEGSILTIVNGEPAWTAPAYRACQQWAEVTLVNNEPVPGEITAFRGDPAPGPDAIWDEYARSQPTWSTPDENAIAGVVNEGQRLTYATFNITASEGKIVLFRVAYRCTCSVVSTGFKVVASCDNENVIPVVFESNMSVTKGPNYHLAEFTFLTNRPAVGDVKFTFNFPAGIAVTYGADEGAFIQAWETEETGTYVARKLKAADLSLEDIKLALNSASNS